MALLGDFVGVFNRVGVLEYRLWQPDFSCCRMAGTHDSRVYVYHLTVCRKSSLIFLD